MKILGKDKVYVEVSAGELSQNVLFFQFYEKNFTTDGNFWSKMYNLEPLNHLGTIWTKALENDIFLFLTQIFHLSLPKIFQKDWLTSHYKTNCIL